MERTDATAPVKAPQNTDQKVKSKGNYRPRADTFRNVYAEVLNPLKAYLAWKHPALDADIQTLSDTLGNLRATGDAESVTNAEQTLKGLKAAKHKLPSEVRDASDVVHVGFLLMVDVATEKFTDPAGTRFHTNFLQWRDMWVDGIMPFLPGARNTIGRLGSFLLVRKLVERWSILNAVEMPPVPTVRESQVAQLGNQAFVPGMGMINVPEKSGKGNAFAWASTLDPVVEQARVTAEEFVFNPVMTELSRIQQNEESPYANGADLDDDYLRQVDRDLADIGSGYQLEDGVSAVQQREQAFAMRRDADRMKDHARQLHQEANDAIYEDGGREKAAKLRAEARDVSRTARELDTVARGLIGRVSSAEGTMITAFEIFVGEVKLGKVNRTAGFVETNDEDDEDHYLTRKDGAALVPAKIRTLAENISARRIREKEAGTLDPKFAGRTTSVPALIRNFLRLERKEKQWTNAQQRSAHLTILRETQKFGHLPQPVVNF